MNPYLNYEIVLFESNLWANQTFPATQNKKCAIRYGPRGGGGDGHNIFYIEPHGGGGDGLPPPSLS